MRQKIGGSLAALGIALAGLSGTPLTDSLGLSLLFLVAGLLLTALAVIYGMSGKTKEEKAKLGREVNEQRLADTKARHALANEDAELAAEIVVIDGFKNMRVGMLAVAENYDDEARAGLIRGEIAPVEARKSAIANRRKEIQMELQILNGT